VEFGLSLQFWSSARGGIFALSLSFKKALSSIPFIFVSEMCLLVPSTFTGRRDVPVTSVPTLSQEKPFRALHQFLRGKMGQKGILRITQQAV
jgi:hypothetical protein